MFCESYASASRRGVAAMGYSADDVPLSYKELPRKTRNRPSCLASTLRRSRSMLIEQSSDDLAWMMSSNR